MIVIAADYIDSRAAGEITATTMDALSTQLGRHLMPVPDRGSGEDIHVLIDSGQTAVDAILLLTRGGRWSVGLGIGDARQPLGTSVRESAGNAFAAARSAVDRAKKKGTRFAVNAVPRHPLAQDLEALTDLLLVIRGRRSEQGWEMRDLVARGLTQAEAAARIGITPQSASKRARAADLRAEDAAIGPLSRIVDALDQMVSLRSTSEVGSTATRRATTASMSMPRAVAAD
jgi:hypothetical protein